MGGCSCMVSIMTTGAACGMRYVFTSYKGKCPVCCPDQTRDDDLSDNQSPDEAHGDNGWYLLSEISLYLQMQVTHQAIRFRDLVIESTRPGTVSDSTLWDRVQLYLSGGGCKKWRPEGRQSSVARKPPLGQRRGGVYRCHQSCYQ